MNNKLTWNEVKEIKELLGRGVSNKQVADTYGVSPNTISDIKRGKSWRAGGLDETQAARVKLLLQKGMTVKEIAEGFEVAPKIITHIEMGEIFTDVEPEKFDGEEWTLPEPLFL